MDGRHGRHPHHARRPPQEGNLISGWAFTFCNGMDQVGFSAGPPQSAGECATQVVDCSKVPDFTLFAVDSPTLIQNAFPNDPADATYSLMLTLLNPNEPYWTITSSNGPRTVKVDPQTGLPQ